MTNSEVTLLLEEIAAGNESASDRLLPLVYDELRKLAQARMSREPLDHTLQPTALVHEAYLRLVRVEDSQGWNGRGHFFGAAAKAMRRILVEHARQKQSLKHGGGLQRNSIETVDLGVKSIDKDELLSLDEALSDLADVDSEAERMVELRYFVGLSNKEAAEALGISPRKGDMLWSFARAWLRKRLES